MKRQNLFAIACVATTAAATLVGNAGSASAAALTGTFNFVGSSGIPSTLISVSGTSLTGSPYNFSFSAPQQVSITSGATGTFIPFSGTNASISNFSTSSSPNVLLDLDGANNPFNTFTYTGISSLFVADVPGLPFSMTSLSVGFNGFFTGYGGEKTVGNGVLSFQIVGQNAAQVNSLLASGGTLSNMTFSGSFMASQAVPEPTALAGLGLVAGVFAVSRRRKANNN